MDKINLTLSPQAYNLIVQAVQELPWRLANPVFQEIDPQVKAALAKAHGDVGPAPVPDKE